MMERSCDKTGAPRITRLPLNPNVVSQEDNRKFRVNCIQPGYSIGQKTPKPTRYVVHNFFLTPNK